MRMMLRSLKSVVVSSARISVSPQIVCRSHNRCLVFCRPLRRVGDVLRLFRTIELLILDGKIRMVRCRPLAALGDLVRRFTGHASQLLRTR